MASHARRFAASCVESERKKAKQNKNDMDDAKELCEYEESMRGGEPIDPLYHAIKLIQQTIFPSFDKFDREALKFQWWYQWTAVAAVTASALSVFFAVAEATKVLPDWTLYAELVAVAATFAAIGLGSFFGFKERWILARFKAERLRLLKFDQLTNEKLWCDPPDLEGAAHCVNEAVENIAWLKYPDALVWARRGIHPQLVLPPCDGSCPDALSELVEYYIPKRLHAQLEYLENHSETVEKWGRGTAEAVVWVFRLSFAAVLCHLVLSLSKVQGNFWRTNVPATDVLACAALFIPIIAGAIRTYRTAHEFERSASRHDATFDSLRTLQEQFEENDDLNMKFMLLGFCELVMEADCREFIRILSEAEWYS